MRPDLIIAKKILSKKKCPMANDMQRENIPKSFNLIYLDSEKEKAIKSKIPWHKIDAEIRDLVQFANSIDGIATVQSCAGHVIYKGDGTWEVDSAEIAFFATKDITMKILFEIWPMVGDSDANLRYFEDGSFWICLCADPSETKRFFEAFRRIKECD